MTRILMAAVLLVGCGVEGATESLVTQRIAIDRDASGIAVDSAGRVFVLDALGISEHVDGAWVSRWSAAPGIVFEDIAALEPGRFALTSRNAGYELDLATGNLNLHFCYLPGEGIREEEPPTNPNPTYEIARAVTFDSVNSVIYAQPQTRDEVTGQGTFSEVAMFDRASGDELRFVRLDDAGYSAGGMAVVDGATFFSAQGSTLSSLAFGGERTELMTLAPIGVSRIEGMAIDLARDELLVLDAPNYEIVALDLDAVLSRAR
jgi:hypothetical protein